MTSEVSTLDVMGQRVDPFDLIRHHVSNLHDFGNRIPVRDMSESKAGYEAALQHLQGAVEALRTLADWPLDSDESAGYMKDWAKAVIARHFSGEQS